MNRALQFRKIHPLLLATGAALAVVILTLALLGTAAPALAHLPQEAEPTGDVSPALEMQPPLPQIYVGVVFTDPALQVVRDLAGNPIGEGVHLGRAACRGDKCRYKTRLDLNTGLRHVRYEYRFKGLQALDLVERRSIIAGTGTIDSGAGKERFLFTATFEDNRDGTIAVTYVASRPDASFIIPSSSGTFEIFSNR